MRTLVLFLLVAVAGLSSCKNTKAPAEALDKHRIEIYELIDAVRVLDPDKADELLLLLTQLELLSTALDDANPAD